MTEIYQVADVFTPTTPAKLTFVERDKINDRLVDALATPGKQLVVYGHSGSGKTTLLLNKLRQMYEGEIITRCVSGLGFDQLVADAFDRLGAVYLNEAIAVKEQSQTRGLKSAYASIEMQLTQSRTSKEQSSHKLVLPPQLTAPTLARFLGAAKYCWVLEDFHKIDQAERTKLAQMMKVFVDMSTEYRELRIVAIGAVGTGRQVVEYDPEMRHRVSEINVPLMTSDELHSIIEKGQVLLNAKIPLNVSRGIVRYSNGLASVCHQLCLNMCRAAGLHQTSFNLVRIQEQDLHTAVQRYLEDASDTLKATFDTALRIRRTGKFDNAQLIIRALLESSDDGATQIELLRWIQAQEPQYPQSNLSHFLAKLQVSDRGSILRFDNSSGRYSFSDPFYRAYASLLLKQSTGNLAVDMAIDIRALRVTVMKLFEDLGKPRDSQVGREPS